VLHSGPPITGTRSKYSEHPPRYDYELTEAGRALIPVLRGLRRWGERFATPGPGRGGAESPAPSGQ